MAVIRLKIRPAYIALAGLISLSGGVGTADAACVVNSCSVTTNADTLGGLDTSLRDAIIYANANPGTTIVFGISNQTITLGGELPLILGNNTVIDGGSNNVIIDGGSTSNTTGYRVFFVGGAGLSGPATTNATIQNLTIANANARGAREVRVAVAVPAWVARYS